MHPALLFAPHVNNSPLNFIDPSGHEPKYGCYSSDADGHCLNADTTPIITGNGKGGRFLNPWEVPIEERLDYIKTLGIRYNIPLPKDNQWAYYPHSGDIGDWYRGLTVYEDGTLRDGNMALEDYAYITASSFANPSTPPPGGFVVTSIKEFVSIMAHEAAHLWQDHYLDNDLYDLYPDPMYETNALGITDLAPGFRSVIEADGFTIQQTWLNQHGIYSGAFYDDVVTNLQAHKSRLAALNVVLSNGQPYTFPLPIHDIVK